MREFQIEVEELVEKFVWIYFTERHILTKIFIKKEK